MQQLGVGCVGAGQCLGDQFGVDLRLGAELRGRDLLHGRVQDCGHNGFTTECNGQLRRFSFSNLKQYSLDTGCQKKIAH